MDEEIPVLKITQTDTLIMEYFSLPTITPKCNFLYRFLEPVPTIWQFGEVNGLSEGALKRFGLDKYNEMIDTNGIDEGNIVRKSIGDVKKVKLFETEMVRKNG